MSSAVTGRLKARRASVVTICSAQADSSVADVGSQTKMRSRVAISLTPVMSNGPST